MLNWISVVAPEEPAQESAELIARRESLRIRPLIEFPALRRAMGLDEQLVGVAMAATVGRRSDVAEIADTLDAGSAPSTTNRPARAKATHGKSPTRRVADPATTTITSKPAAPTRPRGAQGRRFDRRALLESEAA
jgi:hypothetical protein